ncbi:MAG: hypothetical protein WDO56_04300 [Gammaproteobacteria bacterium]
MPGVWSRPYSARAVVYVVLIFLVLAYTGSRVEMGRMIQLSSEAVLSAVGLREQSQVGSGLSKIGHSLFPIVLAERTPVARIENFDAQHLPWLSHIETEVHREQHLNPDTLQMEEQVETRDVLVEPVGYLMHVLRKMLETLELGLWGTVIAIVMSVPLAFFSARNYSPNRATYVAARGRGEPVSLGAGADQCTVPGAGVRVWPDCWSARTGHSCRRLPREVLRGRH